MRGTPAVRDFPHVVNKFDSREACRETVEIYRRPDFNGGVPYGAEVFPERAYFETALRQIGYTGAEIAPLLVKPTADDYDYFFDGFVYGGNTPARAEFLRRVTALK